MLHPVKASVCRLVPVVEKLVSLFVRKIGRENAILLPLFCDFIGGCVNADRKSGEASPVMYRKDRFDAEKAGTFWLSETPDAPGVKGWGAAFSSPIATRATWRC